MLILISKDEGRSSMVGGDNARGTVGVTDSMDGGDDVPMCQPSTDMPNSMPTTLPMLSALLLLCV